MLKFVSAHEATHLARFSFEDQLVDELSPEAVPYPEEALIIWANLKLVNDLNQEAFNRFFPNSSWPDAKDAIDALIKLPSEEDQEDFIADLLVYGSGLLSLLIEYGSRWTLVNSMGEPVKIEDSLNMVTPITDLSIAMTSLSTTKRREAWERSRGLLVGLIDRGYSFKRASS